MAVLVSTIVAFAMSGIYYTVFATRLAAMSEAPAPDRLPPAKVAAELARTLMLATVVTGLARYADIDGLRSGVLLGAALWIGSPWCFGPEPYCTRTRPEPLPPSMLETGSPSSS